MMVEKEDAISIPKSISFTTMIKAFACILIGLFAGLMFNSVWAGLGGLAITAITLQYGKKENSSS